MTANIMAVFQKQIKDTFQNKIVLIQFLIYPLLALVMEHTVEVPGMPVRFFTNLFAVIYMGMAPLSSMSAIIAEEKELNTLRPLWMADVKPTEYLLGIGGSMGLLSIAGALLFALIGAYKERTGAFLIVMAAGILVSLLVGAVIGVWSRNQMMAASISIPVMMVFSFLPMLSMFNDKIGKWAEWIYTQQISNMLQHIDSLAVNIKSAVVLSCNLAAAVMAFIYAYRKKGLK